MREYSSLIAQNDIPLNEFALWFFNIKGKRINDCIERFIGKSLIWIAKPRENLSFVTDEVTSKTFNLRERYYTYIGYKIRFSMMHWTMQKAQYIYFQYELWPYGYLVAHSNLITGDSWNSSPSKGAMFIARIGVATNRKIGRDRRQKYVTVQWLFSTIINCVMNAAQQFRRFDHSDVSSFDSSSMQHTRSTCHFVNCHWRVCIVHWKVANEFCFKLIICLQSTVRVSFNVEWWVWKHLFYTQVFVGLFQTIASTAQKFH